MNSANGTMINKINSKDLFILLVTSLISPLVKPSTRLGVNDILSPIISARMIPLNFPPQTVKTLDIDSVKVAEA